MIQLDNKYKFVLLEALEDLMYKISIQQESFKGQPLTKQRRELTKKQKEVETLQRKITTYSSRD